MCFRLIFVLVQFRDIGFLGETHSGYNNASQKSISELQGDRGAVSTGLDDVRYRRSEGGYSYEKLAYRLAEEKTCCLEEE